MENKFAYQSLESFLKTKGDGYIPQYPSQYASLVGRAAASGDKKAVVLYVKAFVKSLTDYAVKKGYEVTIIENDVYGLLASPATYTKDGGRVIQSSEDKYLERLVLLGRAKKIALEPNDPAALAKLTKAELLAKLMAMGA